jgi:hypothetical protein
MLERRRRRAPRLAPALALMAVLAWPVGAQGARHQVESRIDQLLRRITLEEKGDFDVMIGGLTGHLVVQ